MKTATAYRQRELLPYPNAASRREVLAKAVDFLLVSAISIGLTASLLFLLVLL